MAKKTRDNKNTREKRLVTITASHHLGLCADPMSRRMSSRRDARALGRPAPRFPRVHLGAVPRGRLVRFLSRSGGSQGIGFAIPANMVRVVVASAKGGGKSLAAAQQRLESPVLREPPHPYMLFRNLLYTGLSRAKRLLVVVGTEDAIANAVANQKAQARRTMLRQRISNDAFAPPTTRHL